jgi:hypothetical protein
MTTWRSDDMTIGQDIPPPAPVYENMARAIPERRDRYMDDPRKKSVMLAALLSAMPGLGQVYVGYYPQAFANILTVCAALALVSSGVLSNRLEPMVGLFIAFFWLYNVVDAGRRASLYNQALSGLRPMDLPEDGKVPMRVGSMAGGVALIAAGLVLFSNTMFGIPLEWIAQWWPMGLVAVGAWLVVADRRAKSAASAVPPPE